jgi:hypothetical protein
MDFDEKICIYSFISNSQSIYTTILTHGQILVWRCMVSRKNKSSPTTTELSHVLMPAAKLTM